MGVRVQPLKEPAGGWLQVIGGTAELLACVPAVSAKVLEQWQQRGIVELHNLGLGRGRRVARVALDVLHIAALAELAGLGVQLGYAHEAWLIVRERVLLGAPWAGAFIVRHPGDDFLTVRPFGEGGPDDPPEALVALHIAPLAARVTERIARLKESVS